MWTKEAIINFHNNKGRLKRMTQYSKKHQLELLGNIIRHNGDICDKKGKPLYINEYIYKFINYPVIHLNKSYKFPHGFPFYISWRHKGIRIQHKYQLNIYRNWDMKLLLLSDGLEVKEVLFFANIIGFIEWLCNHKLEHVYTPKELAEIGTDPNLIIPTRLVLIEKVKLL